MDKEQIVALIKARIQKIKCKLCKLHKDSMVADGIRYRNEALEQVLEFIETVKDRV